MATSNQKKDKKAIRESIEKLKTIILVEQEAGNTRAVNCAKMVLKRLEKDLDKV